MEFNRLTNTGIAPALTSCCRFSSTRGSSAPLAVRTVVGSRTGMRHVEESTGGIALNPHVFGACEASERDESAGLCDLCLVVVYTWMATRGVRLSIKNSQDVYTPCVARFVTQPTALHWTSTFGLSICLMRGSRPPSLTMRSLLSAAGESSTWTGCEKHERNILFTAKLPRAALAAR